MWGLVAQGPKMDILRQTHGFTTGEDIASLITDVLLRLQLPLEGLRGQTYDGAANMNGNKKGVQSILIAKQPLADYIHCGAHCCNLIMKNVCDSSKEVRNSLDYLHQLGNLFSNAKVKSIFTYIQEDLAQCPVINAGRIKPLCPTRWIYRHSQINEALKKYDIILKTLEELTSKNYDGASGLLNTFLNGTTYLGLIMGKKIIEMLETINKLFQGKKNTLSGLCKSIEVMIQGLSDLRSEENFSKVFEECSAAIQQNDLEELSLPRQKKPPKRYSGPAPSHGYNSCEEYYRQQFYHMVDTAISGLKSRILDQPGVKKQILLENVLLKFEKSESLNCYPEIDVDALKIELQLFHKNFKVNCLDDARKALSSTIKEVRCLFKSVENLVRLLLVCPASSCEAERSFSALRKLKMYLRSTMTQKRLNHVALCYVHKNILDVIDSKKVAQIFISQVQSRKNIFGVI
ncbi:zinc finger MYM-type protein 1 [Parasteatoda tepidariorum]|uniref:zinc finger MYM-type protein 1 n=1 Tax=Parasteatoda tepidariorum TaxID=114398 RepID=UPI0039BD4B7B